MGLACSSLSLPGKSLESLSNQGTLANVADGQEHTSAWPEVGNEVGCHRAEWGQERGRGPREGYGKSCQRACQAGLRVPEA